MNYFQIFISKGLLFIFFIISSCTKPLVQVSYVPNQPDTTKVLETIAFGSCNKTSLSQDIWSSIEQTESDLWVWLGDVIYADTDDMEKMEEMYNDQKAVSDYATFVKSTPIIGIWDDHDYGQNDGGKDFEAKAEAQQLFLNFLDIPKSAEVRNTEGIYQSYTIGKDDKTVKFILLDTRYFRDNLERNTMSAARYKINETGDILGETQWQWFKEELTNSTATFNIICSSIQIVPEEQLFEKWANFPTARQRFLDLIIETQPNNPVILSGDRHISEVSKIELNGFEQPVYEITSSGLTHAYTSDRAKSEPNKYRVGELINERHFALLKIDWETVEINTEIRDVNGRLLQSVDLE